MSSHSRPDSTSKRKNVARSKRRKEKPDTRVEVTSENEQRSSDYPAEQPPSNNDNPTTTVMIYLAGDNNLTDECIYALTELKRAQADLVRIYVQFDPSDEFLPTQRYEINRFPSGDYPLALDLVDKFPFRYESKKCLKIKSPYGEQRERKGESGTGDPRMLFNFVAFCVDQPHKETPEKTDHYVLIICGHGAGIQRDFLLRDDRPDGYLTIYELRSALRLMRTKLRGKDPDEEFKLDLFGMDVCLMSMAEITYELRDIVDIAIGCESYSPAAGWPYYQTIKKIDREAKRTDGAFSAPDVWETIASDIVKEYVSFYSNYWLGGLSVAMSALKVSRVHRLRELVRDLANEMICELGKDEDTEIPYQPSELEDQKEYDKHRRRKRYPPLSFKDALILAHWRAQSYNGELYVDLADFCDCLAEYLPEDKDIARICHRLSHFIKKHFVIESCTFGRNYQYSYGVSIYFPWQTLVPYYGASIRFPEDTNWITFINTYLKATRRGPRLFFDCPPYHNEHVALRDKRFDVDKLVELNFSEVRMGPDRMGPDRMGMDEGGNPIHSMRNPPIVFIPDCCTTPLQRGANFLAEYWLMQGGFQLKDLLRSSTLENLEKRNQAWPLLTKDAPATPEQFEAENEES